MSVEGAERDDITDQERFENEQNAADRPNVGTSLQARMRAHLEQEQKKHTDFFRIPRFDDLLVVELRRLSFEAIRKIQKRNERVRQESTRELYDVADQLVRATVAIYEIMDDEGYRETEFGWQDVARLLPDPPDNLTDRLAILHVIGTDRIHFLAAEWGSWSKLGTSDDVEEVKLGFETTG
jgi:hypothetical protein